MKPDDIDEGAWDDALREARAAVRESVGRVIARHHAKGSDPRLIVAVALGILDGAASLLRDVTSSHDQERAAHAAVDVIAAAFSRPRRSS